LIYSLIRPHIIISLIIKNAHYCEKL